MSIVTPLRRYLLTLDKLGQIVKAQENEKLYREALEVHSFLASMLWPPDRLSFQVWLDALPPEQRPDHFAAEQAMYDEWRALHDSCSDTDDRSHPRNAGSER